jgi:Predicted membrane protein (DUF2078).
MMFGVILVSIIAVLAIRVYLQPPRQLIPVDNRRLEEQMLDEMYVRGEISVDEYEFKKAILNRH